MIKRSVMAVMLVATTACQSAAPSAVVSTTVVSETPEQASILQSECAIYFAVNAARVDAGLPVIARLTNSCPAGTDSIAADIDPRPNSTIDTALANSIKQRMIARGMPQTTADQVATSTAFEALVIESAAIL